MADPARSRLKYIPGLDGIRGIWVVVGPLLYHAATDTVSGGILGIDLFFTLSSFLIISIALNEFDATGRIDLKAYAGRRARRLLPALLVCLAMLTTYLVLMVPPDEFARGTGAIFSTLTYSANWYEIFSGVSYFQDFQYSPLRHVWSFSIEEQFYIFAPLYLIVVLALFRKRANMALLVTMIVGTALSTWWMGHLYPGQGDPSRVYYGTDTRAHSLFAGIILAVAVRMYGPVRTRTGQLAWVAGAYAATIFFSWAIFEISEQDAWMFEHGGFLMVDDFWGEAEWRNFEREFRRVFPAREIVELPLEHEVFQCVFPLKEKPQVPNPGTAIQGAPYGITWERTDAETPHYRGVYDDDGRLMAIFCHNTDLGDGWEEESRNEWYFKEFSEPKAYPMGINILIYAMTH